MSERFAKAGPDLDRLVAEKFMKGRVRSFSTKSSDAELVFQELARRGYEVDFDELEVVVCSIKRDSKRAFSSWGDTYEEAICRAGLRLVESESA